MSQITTLTNHRSPQNQPHYFIRTHHLNRRPLCWSHQNKGSINQDCHKRFYRHMFFWFIYFFTFETSATASCGYTGIHINWHQTTCQSSLHHQGLKTPVSRVLLCKKNKHLQHWQVGTSLAQVVDRPMVSRWNGRGEEWTWKLTNFHLKTRVCGILWGFPWGFMGFTWDSWEEINRSPENQWLEDVFPIEIVHF